MDEELTGTKGGQGNDRKRGEGMKREEKRRRSEKKSLELFYRQ